MINPAIAAISAEAAAACPRLPFPFIVLRKSLLVYKYFTLQAFKDETHTF
jgi:hypothetical protein